MTFLAIDHRPAVNPDLKEVLVYATGIPIPKILQPLPSRHPWDTVYYGDLGDHRENELTCLPNAPILIPAHQSSYHVIRIALTLIDCTNPMTLDRTVDNGDEDAGKAAWNSLNKWQPIALHREFADVFQNLRLNSGNVAAMKFIASRDTAVVITDGSWALANQSPKTMKTRWDWFLSLSAHTGAGFWTCLPHMGNISRPLLVETLDGVREALTYGLAMTHVAPLMQESWEGTVMCYHSFATRMHETLACEYRHQVVGHQLLLLLIWTDPGAITPELRSQRREAIRHGRWNECCGPPEDAEPVAMWLKRITKPGDLILIPPGTFVIEYSSGSAVVAEGQFLPWFCLPRLSLLTTSPEIYILKALLLIAPTCETSGRATRAQIRALIKLVSGRQIILPGDATRTHRKCIEEMEKRLTEIIKQYTRV